jgi:hypothetical protein
MFGLVGLEVDLVLVCVDVGEKVGFLSTVLSNEEFVLW